SARKSEIKRRFCGLSSTMSRVASRTSFGDGIALLSETALQQRHQLIFLQMARQGVHPARERSQGLLLLQLERELLDPDQLAQARELEQRLEHAAWRSNEPFVRAPLGGGSGCLGLRVAPAQAEAVPDDVDQIARLEWFAQAGREGVDVGFGVLEI